MVFVLEAVILTELNRKGDVTAEELNTKPLDPFLGGAVIVAPVGKIPFETPFLAVKRIGDAPVCVEYIVFVVNVLLNLATTKILTWLIVLANGLVVGFPRPLVIPFEPNKTPYFFVTVSYEYCGCACENMEA
jgi:hypothetical protein